MVIIALGTYDVVPTSMSEETEIVVLEVATLLDGYVHVAVLFATGTVELTLEDFLISDQIC